MTSRVLTDEQIERHGLVYDAMELEHDRVEEEICALARRVHVQTQAQRRFNDAALPPVGTLGRSAAQLLAQVPTDVDWLVPGLLGPGWLVKLSAREKAGKGVFCAYLLGCLERGDDSVFGPSAVAASLVYTEEPEESIREKIELAGLETATIVSGHELGSLSWDVKVDALVDEAVYHGHRIVFIDNLARATGVTGGEENDNTLGRLVGELGEKAKAAGLAVLLNHHHKKGAGSGIWDKSRGGTALAAACDVNVEMEEVGGPDDRRRRLSSRGRLRDTCWVRGVALSGDGGSYTEADVPNATTGRADKRAQVHQVDLMMLRGQAAPVTARAFADLLGLSTVNAGKSHLDKLVTEGAATKDTYGREHTWIAA